MKQLPLFVYGTLKRGEPNYPLYLEGQTVSEQPASIVGAVLYRYVPYPYLVLDADLVDGHAQVQGMLMTIRPTVYDRVLQRINWLEDYHPGNPDNEYERVVCTAQTAAGMVEAWVYVAGARVLAAIRAGKIPRVTGGVWGKSSEDEQCRC